MNDFSPFADLHLTPELVKALEGALPPLVRAALVLCHLAAVNPEIAENPRVLAFIDRQLARAEPLARPKPWEKELARLDALDPDERRRVIGEAPPDEMASLELARTFGRRAVDALPGDPDTSLHWATLCGTVAHRGETDEHRQWSAHWLVLAGNAERARGRLDAAAKWFALLKMEDAVNSAPPEPWMASERAKMLGSWHLERAEFGKTREMAARAGIFANLAREPERLGRAALLGGAAYFDLGRFRAAVGAHRVAKDIYAPEERPVEASFARLNEAAAWVEANNSSAGRGVLLRNQKLFYSLGDMPYFQLRRRWTDAKAAYGVGEFLEAEGIFRRVLEGFLDEEALTEATLVTIDLVLFFLLRGLWDEVTAVGEWAMPQLRALAESGTTPEVDIKLEILARTVANPRKAPVKALIRATGIPRIAAINEPPETLL